MLSHCGSGGGGGGVLKFIKKLAINEVCGFGNKGWCFMQRRNICVYFLEEFT
jgi:hypothetical protein